MTGFSKFEAQDKGIKSIVEIKSLNARYLEINCRIPRSLSSRELEIRELVKSILARGTVSVSVTLEFDGSEKPFFIDENAAINCHKSLDALRKKLHIKEPVGISHLLQFSDTFTKSTDDRDSETEWVITKKVIKEALKVIDKMRSQEGQQINKDFNLRIKKINEIVQKIVNLSSNRIPEEREKMRMKVAQLFESDEIDEQRLQMEIVFLANKLDISEECVRLKSHIMFFNDTLKAKEPVGQKLNFLLQEMNREINTIGSKSDNAEISQMVVAVKEELERLREQAQNIE